MIACACEGSLPRVYRATRPRARVAHRCSECGAEIRPHERYEAAAGIWEDGRAAFKTCSHCLAMRDLVEARARCWCWCHGTLREDLGAFLEDAQGQFPGLAFAVGRLEIERRSTRRRDVLRRPL
jgi:hypothetical protein